MPATRLLAELSEPSRRSIVEHLREGKKNVSQLVQLTGLKQPNVSNHLARLREEGLVTAEKAGREVLYSLTPSTAVSLERLSAELISVSNTRDASKSELAGWADRYFTCAVDADSSGAIKVIDEAIAAHVSYVDVCVGILQPALYRIGEWYSKGRITEADEHFATALTDRLLAKISDSYVRKPANGKSAILGSVQGNRHSVGLRMAADLLEMHGYSVRYLGADVPTTGFAVMVLQAKPSLTLLSCATDQDILSAMDVCREIKGKTEQTKVLVGGIAADRNRKLLMDCCDAVCKDLRDLERQLA